MENRKLQFAVYMRLQFHIAGTSNFSKAFIGAAMLFFIKSKYITFIAQKQE